MQDLINKYFKPVAGLVDDKTRDREMNKIQFVHNSELYHSHKKRKDSLEGSLDRVLLAAKVELPKILVPRLPQHTSDINIECAGKLELSKQQCSLHVTSFLEH